MLFNTVKNSFALAALAALGLSLASATGCSDRSDDGARGAGGGDTLTVGFSQIGAESDWRRANTTSIQSEAEKRGIDLRFSDAQQKQENQIKAIRSFIAQRVDVIAFSPVVETGWEPVLREAKQARIPVVLTDRAVEVSDDSLYVTFIGSDFAEEGKRAARWLVEETGGQAVIAELQGTPGSAPAIDRAAGFREVIADYPGMEIVWSQSGNFTRTEGKKAFQAFLKSPEAQRITTLYAHNDDMAIGAIQAIKEAGKDPGDDILVVSIDAVKEAFRAMQQGDLNCTVECNPLIGAQLFDLVEKVAAGEEVPKRVQVEEGVFTQADADELIDSRQY